MNIAIIGGGASGMFCALNIDSQKHKVTLFEKNDSTLKKLLITGNGRCNVTNLQYGNDLIENYLCNASFLHSSFNLFSPYDMVNFLTNNNVEVKVEDGNRVFPVSNKAITIKNCFDELVSKNVDLKLNTCVLSVEVKDDKYVLETNNGYYTFDALIVATGGVSFPTTGSSGDGHKFASNLKLDVVSPRSSLCAIRLQNTPSNFEGLPLNCKITLKSENKSVCSNTGEFLFTGFGVSGPNVFTLTSKINKHSINGDVLVLDLIPQLIQEDVVLSLKDYISLNSTKFVVHALNSLINLKIAKLILERLNISEKKQCAQISNAEILKMAEMIKSLEFEIDNFDNLERATITRGGVSVKEINPKNMESKKYKNLFFIGEVLDVDGLSGGFNLQIAFSTAYACANYLNQE